MEFDTTLYEQGPNARLDYDVDFSRWLPAGDSIASVDEVTVEGSTATVDDDDTVFTSTTVKVWLEGGAVGDTAHVSVKITSAQGRETEECFQVRIREDCA